MIIILIWKNQLLSTGAAPSAPKCESDKVMKLGLRQSAKVKCESESFCALACVPGGVA